MQLFLGIDGGGTRCRARLRNAEGAQIGEAEGGLANVYQDFDGAIAAIIATAQAAAAAAGLPAGSLAHADAGLGLAGVISDQDGDRVRAAGLPFRSAAVESDGYIACLGAHGGQDGGIVISGTGSAALALVNGRRYPLGGWGNVVGDDGSGAVIGREALHLAVLAYDEILPMSPLLRQVLDRFDGNVPRLVEWARTALSRDFGSFAPMVFAAAEAGDPHGLFIVGQAADAVAALARGLLRRGAPRIVLVGSVAQALAPRMPADVAACIVPAMADPLEGALIMARRAAQARAGSSA